MTVAGPLAWRPEPPDVDGWWLHAYDEWPLSHAPIELRFTGPISHRIAIEGHLWMGPILLPAPQESEVQFVTNDDAPAPLVQEVDGDVYEYMHGVIDGLTESGDLACTITLTENGVMRTVPIVLPREQVLALWPLEAS